MTNRETITKTEFITPDNQSILFEYKEAFYKRSPVTVEGIEYFVDKIEVSSGFDIPPDTLKVIFILVPVKNYPEPIGILGEI
ncbi:MAG: hypothetical protein WC998_01410 [Candidatus Paceibacterota bacterium]|jgi:hypothetical protein